MTTQGQDTIRLEGFAEPLKHGRTFCVGTPNALPALLRSRLELLDGEVAHRGRKILILQEGCTTAPWLFRLSWDAVFQVRDAQDLRLALTVATHAVKPVRVVWAGGEPPAAAFQALARCEQCSLLGFGTAAPAASDWTTVYWSHDMKQEAIEPVVQQRMGALAPTSNALRATLREIQASEVGLVWSNVGESDRRGSLYWFDPAEGGRGSHALYTPVEAAEVLRSIADSLQGGRNP